MNVCEYRSFVNITDLYRHKYSAHYKESLVLHNHTGSKKGSDSDFDLYNKNLSQSKEVISYEEEPQLESNVDLYGKRKRVDSDLEDNHEVKRYKKELEQIITPRAKAPNDLPKIKAPRRFYQPKEELLIMDTDETKNQVTPANFETGESHNQVVEVKPNNPMVNQRVMVCWFLRNSFFDRKR